MARRLTGWDTLQFELRDDEDMAFEDFVVYRDPVPEGAASAVIVESRHRDLKFKRDDEDATTRIRANDDDLHIVQIHYGDHFICVANSGQPEEGPCERKGDAAGEARGPAVHERLVHGDAVRRAGDLGGARHDRAARGFSAGPGRGPRRRPSRAADRP